MIPIRSADICYAISCVRVFLRIKLLVTSSQANEAEFS